MKKIELLIVTTLLISLSTGYAQDSTQTELNKSRLSGTDASGNTKMLLTAVAWFGFQAHLNDTVKTDVKNNFNSYGFSPMFLWKLSDKLFFESEIEINNGEFELEFAKLSYSLNKYITIGAGRMLTPFGAYAERWEPVHIERFPNAPLRPDDDLLPDNTHLFWGAIMGVDVRGGIPMGSANMNYSLYVSNGPSLAKDETGALLGGVVQYENLDDNNNNKEVGGRIGFLPFSNSSLEIGFSGKHGIAGDEGDSAYKNIGATAYAFDLNYVKAFKPLKSIIGIRSQFNSVTIDKSNYIIPDDSTGATYTFDNTLQNYFMQVSFRPALSKNKFLQNIELLFRYNAITPPKDAVWGPKDTNGKGGTITRTDIGLCYWLSWRTGLRFAYETQKNPDGEKNNQFLIRFATGF